MVASAKLHKAQGRIENMLPYQRKLNEILTNFLRTDVFLRVALYREKTRDEGSGRGVFVQ